MKKRFTIKRVFLHFVIIAASFLIICRYSNIQQRFCPEKYWAGKINEYENVVQYNNWKINSLEIKLEKKRTNKVYKIQEGLVKANSFNHNKEHLLIQIEKDHEKNIDHLRKKISQLKVERDIYEKKLNLAKKNYYLLAKNN